MGYVNHYPWFHNLIEAIRKLNTEYNNGRTGYNSKKAFDWENSKYLNRWEPVGNNSVFVKSRPVATQLRVRAMGLHKWAVAKLNEEHV